MFELKNLKTKEDCWIVGGGILYLALFVGCDVWIKKQIDKKV